MKNPDSQRGCAVLVTPMPMYRTNTLNTFIILYRCTVLVNLLEKFPTVKIVHGTHNSEYVGWNTITANICIY